MSTDARSLTPLAAADYEAIEQAVMETSRGRWFLQEYAARNRHADTTILLGAIERLERAVSGEKAAEQVERMRFDLLEMSRAIVQLKADVDATRGDGSDRGRFDEARPTLDGIARTSQKATSAIIAATEDVQELAWSLREKTGEEDVCDRLDRLAREIYAACAFQDVAARRTDKAVRTLRSIEGRINALVDAWAPGDDASSRRSTRPDNVLPFRDNGLHDDDIDVVVIGDDATAADHGGQAGEADIEIDDVEEDDIEARETDAQDGDPRTTGTLRSGAQDSEAREIEAREIQVPEIETPGIDVGRTEAEPSAGPAVAVAAERPSRRPPTLAELDSMPAATKALVFG